MSKSPFSSTQNADSIASQFTEAALETPRKIWISESPHILQQDAGELLRQVAFL